MELNKLTITGACSKGNRNDLNAGVDHAAPIKLTDYTCHYRKFNEALAIGGKAFVQNFV